MKKPHYAWAVCFAGMLLVLCCMGAVSNAFTVYLPYVQREGGYSGAQGSAIMTVRCMFSLLSMFAVNLYYDKLGLRRGIGLICMINTAGYAVYALADNLPMYFLGAALTGMAYGIGAMIPASLLMNRWFASKRTTAIAVCAAGTGIATIVLPPAITFFVETLGLGAAFGIQALFLAVCGGVICLLVRNDPAEMDLSPYGAGENATQYTGSAASLSRGMQLALCFALLLLGCVSTSGTAHYGVLFSTNGYSPTSIAVGLSVMGIALTIGKGIYGVVSDRLGGFRTSMLSFAAMLAANIVCFLASPARLWTLPAVMLLTGLGYPPATVGISVWAGDFSAPESYARTLKWYQVAYALGGLLFATVPGLVYDLAGNYNVVYLLCAAFVAVLGIILAAAYRMAAKTRISP